MLRAGPTRRRAPRRRLLAGAITVLAGALASPAAAGAAGYAPVDAAGPDLEVSSSVVREAMRCSPGVGGASRAPVLLLHGTNSNARDNWDWTYVPALDAAGIPWCTLDLPGRGTGDLQVAAEYVVSALRRMHERAGRTVSVIGHSQGGMLARWALRFWPAVRPMVDDVVGLAPTNHGTRLFDDQCAGSGCPVANLQQRRGSRFIAALNSRQETFAGVSYTNVATRTDIIATPFTTAFLDADGPGRVTNVAIQDVCPLAVSEHLLLGFTDPIAYALAMDALAHEGPADPARLPRSVCGMSSHPGIDQSTALGRLGAAIEAAGRYQVPPQRDEPELRCYATGTCPPRSSSDERGSDGECRSRRRFTVRLPRWRGKVTATLNGRPLRLRRRDDGRLVTTVDLRGRGRSIVTLRIRGTSPRTGRRVMQVRRYRVCGA